MKCGALFQWEGVGEAQRCRILRGCLTVRAMRRRLLRRDGREAKRQFRITGLQRMMDEPRRRNTYIRPGP